MDPDPHRRHGASPCAGRTGIRPLSERATPARRPPC